MGKEIIVTTLEEMCELMCDNYCRYPDTVASQEELDDICESCPLNDLQEGE